MVTEAARSEWWMDRPGGERLVQGQRVVLERGEVRSSARDGQTWLGFAPRPSGGWVLWTAHRVYVASDFVGDVSPVLEERCTGASPASSSTMVLECQGGPRWLGADGVAKPLAASLSANWPGREALAEAVVVRAAGPGLPTVFATRDLFGQVAYTRDGVNAAFEPAFRANPWSVPFVSEGNLIFRPHPGAPYRTLVPHQQSTDRSSFDDSRPLRDEHLAPQELEEAALHGALVGSTGTARILTISQGGVSMLSGVGLSLLASRPWQAMGESFRNCELVEAPESLLAVCTHEHGAHVLRLGARLGESTLEATFPPGKGFVVSGAQLREGGLAYLGECGRQPPSGRDFAAGAELEPPVVRSYDEPDTSDPPAEPEPRPNAYCVRQPDGTWLEGGFAGEPDDVLALVPTPSGNMVVLRRANDDEARSSDAAPTADRQKAPVGAREISLSDAALEALAVELPAQASEADYGASPRCSRRYFWSGADIGVWASSEAGSSAVRIGRDGKVRILTPLEGTSTVFHGGRFAVARMTSERGDTYFESTDGGEHWGGITPPPVPLTAMGAWSGRPSCGPLGCAFNGVVRFGWGSVGTPEPVAPAQPADLEPPPRAAAPSVSCELAAELPAAPRAARANAGRVDASGGEAAKPGSPSSGAALGWWRSGAAGRLEPSAWKVERALPFGATSAVVSLSPAPAAAVASSVPLLGPRGVGLLVLAPGRAYSLTDAPARSFSRVGEDPATSAIELGDALFAISPRGVCVGRGGRFGVAVPGPLLLSGEHEPLLGLRGEGAQARPVVVAWSEAGTSFGAELDVSALQGRDSFALPGLERLALGSTAACAGPRPSGSVRFLAQLRSVRVQLRTPGGSVPPSSQALALLSTRPGALCLERLDLATNDALPITLVFDSSKTSAIRGAGSTTARCVLPTPPPP